METVTFTDKKKIAYASVNSTCAQDSNDSNDDMHLACVASVSARVRRESWEERKERNDGGGGGERRGEKLSLKKRHLTVSPRRSEVHSEYKENQEDPIG